MELRKKRRNWEDLSESDKSQRAAGRKGRAREGRPKAFVDDPVENVMLHAALSLWQPGAHPREQRPAELTHHMPHDRRPDSHQHSSML